MRTGWTPNTEQYLQWKKKICAKNRERKQWFALVLLENNCYICNVRRSANVLQVTMNNRYTWWIVFGLNKSNKSKKKHAPDDVNGIDSNALINYVNFKLVFFSLDDCCGTYRISSTECRLPSSKWWLSLLYLP